MNMNVLSHCILFACFCSTIYAASIPFGVDGTLQGATTSGTEYNAGGTMVVDGMSITIPKNLQVQFPATWVSWPETVSAGLGGYEVSVIGNIVDGKPIAGLVQLSQLLLQGGDGIISALTNDGLITLSSGQKLRINDPNAVFSAGYTARPLFTADDANPSVTAYSGFPMCVPRSASDPKCPASNRPAGQTTFAAPDSSIMAPFLVGDFVTYSGIVVAGEVICYSIVADGVIITTTGVPPYIRMEDAIIGVVDSQAAATVAFADTRFVGYVSDSSAQVNVYRMEVDPCSGAVTEVGVGSAVPSAPRGKFVFRASGTTTGKYTREYMIRTSGGTRATNGGQITAGQYVQPVTDWIFPEFAGGVVPRENDVSNFLHLRNGFGLDSAGNLWGQLSPWPGATTPTPASCAAVPSSSSGSGTLAPVADAGVDQKVRPGVLVNLKAAVSNAASFPSGDLSYAWNQTAGPAVTLSAADTASASFQAPSGTADVTCTFRVTIKSASNANADAALSTKTVNITSSSSAADVVTIDSYTWTTQQSGTIAVTAHSNVVDGSVTRMSLTLNNPNAGTAITMVSEGKGRFTYSARNTKQPSNGITVKSNFNGAASRTTLSARRRRRWDDMVAM